MHVSKRVIQVLLLVFISTASKCCDIQHYSAVCEEQQIRISVSFEKPFDGTLFANGFLGHPNCSTPNMETSGSNIIYLSLPFMECNTTIERVEGKEYLQAKNTITIQFHPLIKSVLDCEIISTCDIDYSLPDDFFRSYLNRSLELPTPVKSSVDIMSGAKMFGRFSDILEVTEKQFLILNVTYGGDNRNNYELRVRKCYAHAEYVIDNITDPDLLLDDDRCANKQFVNSLELLIDESYTDLRDFAEIRNFILSFTQQPFYITCAFDICSKYCPYYCFGEMEIKNSIWSTVRTYLVETFDESFTGFIYRKKDFKKIFKMLSERLVKLKEVQMARKNSINSKRRAARLDASEDVANIKASENPQEETFITNGELDETSTTVDISNVAEEISVAGINQNATRHSSEDFIGEVNLNSEKEEFERFEKRSIVDENVYFDVTIADSPKLKIAETSDKSIMHINGTDCFNSTCAQSKDTSISLENLINSTAPKSSISELEEEMFNTSDYNLTVVREIFITSDNSNEKDCVPYLKFASVTASLSVLSVCLFLVCISVVLYTRKERKRLNSHSKYLYSDF